MSSGPKLLISQFVAVFLVALNMRITVSGVGPLLNDIAESRGVSAAALGLLASVPLLAWGLVSPLAHSVSERLGMDRTITWSLIALGLATVWRSLSFSPANLWLGTILMGASLAVANVIMPAIVKRDFGRHTASMMGLYSAALGGASGLGTAVALPVARAQIGGSELGWEAGLLASGLLVPVALVAWLLVSRRTHAARAGSHAAENGSPGMGRRVWLSPTAWLLACYMGCQSMTFYISATWMAPIMVSHGMSASAAGWGVTLFHFGGMVGSLIVPVLLRFDHRDLLPVTLPIVLLVGSIGLVFVPQAAFVWATVLGLCGGAALSVALTLVAQRSADIHTASAVSGMTQSLGYLIAALGPALFGWAFDVTGDWVLPLGVTVVALIVLFTAGWILRDGRTVKL